jgi:hypothetical protein
MSPLSQQFASYNSTSKKFSTSSISSLRQSKILERMDFRKGDKNAIEEF